MKHLIKSLRPVPIMAAMSIFGIEVAPASTVNSVLIDETSSEIVVLGTDLLDADFALNNVLIPSSCITLNSTTEQHIDFCSEVASAVPGEGSYKLEVNSSLEFSVYAEQAINAPAPPPPPPIDNNCACITGISENGIGQWLQPPIPSDNLTLCLWYQPIPPYTEQVWISGSFSYGLDFYSISALWDPTNPTYDPANPGNSTSVCALHNETTGSFDVHHPIASDEQFDACFDWMLRYGGPCL